MPKYTFAYEFLAEWMPRVNKNLEPIKNPSVNGASDVFNDRFYEPIVPSASDNFEPKEVLILPHDLNGQSKNHEVCSAARTRTWNHLLTRNP